MMPSTIDRLILAVLTKHLRPGVDLDDGAVSRAMLELAYKIAHAQRRFDKVEMSALAELAGGMKFDDGASNLMRAYATERADRIARLIRSLPNGRVLPPKKHKPLI